MYRILIFIITLALLGLLGYLYLHNQNSTEVNNIGKDQIINQQVVQNNCATKKLITQDFPAWSLLVDCMWEDSVQQEEQLQIQVKNKESQALMQLKFSMLEGYGSNSLCYNDEYEYISDQIVRISKGDGSYVYALKELGFAPNGTALYYSIKSDGFYPEDEDFNYCISVSPSFTTTTSDSTRPIGFIYIDITNVEKDEVSKIDEIILNMTY